MSSLTGNTILALYNLLREQTRFDPQNTFYFDNTKLIVSIPVDNEYLQIIPREKMNLNEIDNHWTCIHYYQHKLKIYDNRYDSLSEVQDEYISYLFPYNPKILFCKSPEKQPVTIDSGFHAIANATSRALEKNLIISVFLHKRIEGCVDNMMQNQELKLFPLNPIFESYGNSSYVLNNERYLEDNAIAAFHQLLNEHTRYRPRDIYFIQIIDQIDHVKIDEEYLQIIYREGSEDVGH